MADSLIDTHQVPFVIGEGGGLQVQIAEVRYVPFREVGKADIPIGGNGAILDLFLEADNLAVQLLLHLSRRQLLVRGSDKAVPDLLAVHINAGSNGDAVALSPLFYGCHECFFSFPACTPAPKCGILKGAKGPCVIAGLLHPLPVLVFQHQGGLFCFGYANLTAVPNST